MAGSPAVGATRPFELFCNIELGMTATALDRRRHDALVVSINDDAVEVIDLRGLIKTGLVELSLVNHHVALV